MEHTAEQHTAIYTHDKNLIVVAGAGSGKTRVLVERYLALLDANPDWPLNALAAITFTKKAAGEMRDRVRQALENRQRAADTPQARRRWSDLLASMDSARIDTIHGLCASLLRANAAQAAVDPDFTVLDETDARILLDDVIDDTLQRLAEAGDPAAELFTEYELSAIRAALSDPEVLNAEPDDAPGDLLERWQFAWEQEAAAYLEDFKRRVGAIGVWQPAAPGDALADSWRLCLDCLDRLYQQESVYDCVEALGQIAALNLRGGSVKAWGDKDTLEAARGTLKAIRDRAREAQTGIGDAPGETDRRAARLLPLWVDLLRRVQAAYCQAKAAQGVLDFNDLETRTRALLNDHPDVRARYRGAEFRHVLVDEFQDTNAAQWDIIRALADVETPGSLFVVGDPKQSIYAFRGADVSVFGAVEGQILSAGGHAVSLARSFRAHAPLVACFNAVFGRLLTRDERSPVRDYQVTLGEPMTAARRPAERCAHPGTAADRRESAGRQTRG